MTALDCMNEILDINEMVEWLRSNNMQESPNLEFCKIDELLTKYRKVLVAVMNQVDLFPMDK